MTKTSPEAQCVVVIGAPWSSPRNGDGPELGCSNPPCGKRYAVQMATVLTIFQMRQAGNDHIVLCYFCWLLIKDQMGEIPVSDPAGARRLLGIER